MSRIRLAAIIAAAAFAAGCHSEPTAPDTRAAANAAAQQLLQLADSLQQHGGSAGEIGAYRGLASLLVGTGRLSSVTISVDDAASEYLATAQEIQFGSPCPPGAACAAVAPSLPPDHAFIAWQKSDPRRMVQLFVHGYDMPALSGGPSVAMVTIPSLLYFDGSGSLYSGAATTRSITVTTSDTPCTRPGNDPAALYPAPWPCRQAEFTVAFDGSAQLMPLEGLFASDSAVTPSANAAPSHRIAMASQQVHGSHLEFTPTCHGCVDSTQPGSAPPVTMPWRDSLSATLTTTVNAGDVTFTFTVRNMRDSTATLRFNDSQQFDIRVWDANDTLVWRWGADQAFTQALTSRTLAPGESGTFVAHWKPASPGSYHAMAYLTSSSHGAVAFANVAAP